MRGLCVWVMVFFLISVSAVNGWAQGKPGIGVQEGIESPTPAPIQPSDTIPLPSGREVKEEAIGFVAKIVSFFRDDFFPNLWIYLTIVFMIVLAVVAYFMILFLVRSVTDPIFHKVFRFKEQSRTPAIIGGLAAIVIAFFIFQWIYTAFPALQPPMQFFFRHFR